MSESIITDKARELITKSVAGYEIETSKVDCKLKWYDLKSLGGKNEFIKDITAIINSIGQDGYIIIGFKDSNNKFNNSKFKDSGLVDTAEVQNLIASQCSNVFTVNIYDFKYMENELSVIHLPPIQNKPIFILKHYKRDKEGKYTVFEKERIFIRRGSTNSIANKSDLELIYYDKNNFNNDYDYSIDVLGFTLRTIERTNNRVKSYLTNCHLDLMVENYGKRIIAIKTATIKFESNGSQISESAKHYIKNGNSTNVPVILLNLKPGENNELKLRFTIQEDFNIENSGQENSLIELKLTNDKTLTKKLEIY